MLEIVRGRKRDVRCLTLPSQNTGHAESKGCEVFPADLTKAHTLDGVCNGIKTVFHCAGIIHPRRTGEFFSINTHGTQNLIKEAVKAGVDKFIYVSSNSASGCNTSRDVLMKEDDPPRPYKNYGLSKYRAEAIVQDYQAQGLIKTTIIRPCWYYGPGQPERQTRFFRMIKTGKPIMFGDGKNLRSMSYVDNVVQGLLLAEEKDQADGQIYWIADKQPYPTIRIYQTIAELLGVTLKFRRLPAALSGMCEFIDTALQSVSLYSPEIHVAGELAKDIACSIEKAERELGYKPEIELEEGMRRSIEWCRANGMDI